MQENKNVGEAFGNKADSEDVSFIADDHWVVYLEPLSTSTMAESEFHENVVNATRKLSKNEEIRIEEGVFSIAVGIPDCYMIEELNVGAAYFKKDILKAITKSERMSMRDVEATLMTGAEAKEKLKIEALRVSERKVKLEQVEPI